MRLTEAKRSQVSARKDEFKDEANTDARYVFCGS